MDVTFSCFNCKQHLAIHEDAAGQIVDCPKCGKKLVVPNKSVALAAVPQAPPASLSKKCPACREQVDTGAIVCVNCGTTLKMGTHVPASVVQPSASRPAPTSPSEKKCPYCAEMIHAEAIKCKHCGEFFNGVLRGQSIAPAPERFYPATPAKAETVSQGNIAAGYILALVVPFIGFFAGIYLLAKKESGHGIACIAISIFAFFIWFAGCS